MPDPELHDAILLDIQVTWSEARAILRFRVEGRVHSIIVDRIRDVHVRRELPWGPSISVNSASLIESPTGGVHLSIEMQSGDLIEVVGETMAEV